MAETDPALRRYLEKEFAGGETQATLAARGGAGAPWPGPPTVAVAEVTAGFWAEVKRALFRQPRRTHAVGLPGPH